MKKNGFTLAEVLITLGIIGIVAALTLPTLITNAKEKQRVSQLKKVYTALQQAFLSAEEKHGEFLNWDLTKTDTGNVDDEGNKILDYTSAGKIIGYFSENLNTINKTEPIELKFYTLDGELNAIGNYTTDRYIKLNDGTIIISGWVNTGNMDFVIYYPGCEKRGCRLGVDLFYFKLLPKKGFVPMGVVDYPAPANAGFGTNFETSCNRRIKSGYNGRGCTAWVIYKENMDYLHCDDLHWYGKNKCK